MSEVYRIDYIEVGPDFGLIGKHEEAHETKEGAIARAKELFNIKHANDQRKFININITHLEPNRNIVFVPWWN